MPTYFMLYGLARFLIEFLRGDHNPAHIGALTDQQIFSILLVVGGLALFILMLRPPKHSPKPA
jgi:prolipoprotein diacylglyceryltransferase